MHLVAHHSHNLIEVLRVGHIRQFNTVSLFAKLKRLINLIRNKLKMVVFKADVVMGGRTCLSFSLTHCYLNFGTLHSHSFDTIKAPKAIGYLNL